MSGKVAAARDLLAGGEEIPPSTAPETAVQGPDELREILKKFRRAMGLIGNPGTLEAEVALRAGWVIASGTVEGYGDEVFHVFMLTNGALFYFSGELEGPVDFTGRWVLGDSIPALEAKIPDTVAGIMARHGADWPSSPQLL